jgi:hypothetical protein
VTEPDALPDPPDAITIHEESTDAVHGQSVVDVVTVEKNTPPPIGTVCAVGFIVIAHDGFGPGVGAGAGVGVGVGVVGIVVVEGVLL